MGSSALHSPGGIRGHLKPEQCSKRNVPRGKVHYQRAQLHLMGAHLHYPDAKGKVGSFHGPFNIFQQKKFLCSTSLKKKRWSQDKQTQQLWVLWLFRPPSQSPTVKTDSRNSGTDTQAWAWGGDHLLVRKHMLRVLRAMGNGEGTFIKKCFP